MKNETEYKVDRTGWKSGPWDGEPDRVQWRTRAGLPGLIVRNDSGALCGYAAVPPGHPARNLDYDELDVSVHGGLTYGGECAGVICHMPEPGEPDDVFWFGFDCAHYLDVRPGDARFRGLSEIQFSLGGPVPVYRTIEYVRAEVEKLAEQLVLLGQHENEAPRPGGAA